MDALKQWIQQNLNSIQSIGVILIVSISGIIAAWLLVKAILALRKGQMNEFWKWAGYAALAVIVGLMGYLGFKTLISNLAPNSAVLPRSTVVASLMPMIKVNGLSSIASIL